MADLPKIFYEEPQTIIDRMVARYSALVNRPMEKQQAESLLIQTLAEEVVMIRAAGDIGISQMLVQFSTSPMIDYLSANTGVQRLGDAPAVATLVFTLLPGHGVVTIQKGTRVGSQDGLMVFQTDIDIVAAPSTDTLTVSATAMLDGPQGNKYAPGQISTLIDPKPFVTGVANLYVTSGGADVETTEGLRNRIILSPNQNTTAGSVQSYKFWALTANSAIIDVEVVSPKDSLGNAIGGQVLLYPLISGGVATPQAILTAVQAATSGENRRPVSDNVSVLSPTRVEYVIPLEIVLKAGAIQADNETRILNAISAYVVKQQQQLGADITESQIKAAGMNDDVYAIRLPGFTDKIIKKTEFAVCTNISKISVTYEDVNA